MDRPPSKYGVGSFTPNALGHHFPAFEKTEIFDLGRQSWEAKKKEEARIRRFHMAKIPTREVVRAKLFQLVNDKGDVVAELKTTGDGYPSLSLLDKAGKKRLVA